MKLGAHPLTLRQLQYVVAVADAKSFRRAAASCHVSQPSLSAQIAEVERTLGVRLFERDRRNVLLTAAGAEVVERARAIVVAVDDLLAAATHHVDPLAGTLPIALQRIGVIRSPFEAPAGTPIQAAYAIGTPGEVVLDDAFEPALADIEGFERLWLLYWFDRAMPFQPRVVPYRDTRERGLFATRSPCRPNPIGLSAIRLVRREGRVLHVLDVDILDGTPLLDIKPYVPAFDAHPEARAGWLDGAPADRRQADSRFQSRGDP